MGPFLLFLIVLAVFGGINAIIANAKGFNPILWFFAAGLLGLIVVSVLPSANKAKEDPEEYDKRRKKADRWGYGILIFAGIMIIIRILGSLG